MTRQSASPDEAERKRLFVDVLRIFAAHQPVIYFAAPRVYVAVSSRMSSLTPAVFLMPVLWDPDSLAVIPGAR
jgi:ABC-type transport system substrate-binding protein